MDDLDKTVVSGGGSSMPPGGDGDDSDKTMVAGGMPSMPPLSGSEPFYKIWIRAVTKPNEQTYADIAESADSNTRQAYLWVFLASVVGNFLVFLASGVVSLFSGTQDTTTAIATMICGGPIAGIVVTIIFVIDVAIFQWVGKMFKGVATFNQLLYTLAAIAAPISLVAGALGALSSIPLVGLCFSILSIVLLLYTIYLNITPIKSRNKFGWGEAAGTVLIPAVVFGCLCGCLAFAATTLLGASVGSILSGY